MSGPDISPLLGRLGGDQFREDLRKRLEELADETDDQAYASRLRLVAKGARPLRTLMHDPQWRRQFVAAPNEPETPTELSNEQREALDERMAAVRAANSAVFLSAEQAESDAAEIALLADRSDSIMRQEELSGWGHVHAIDDESGGRDDQS